MSNSEAVLDEIYSSLGVVDWSKTPDAIRETSEILGAIWARRGEFFRALSDVASKGPIMSVRTNELVSWKLAQLQNGGCIALNEFCPGPKGEESVNIHEHAQPLVVLGVAGGYSQHYYCPPKPTDQYEEGEPFCDFQKHAAPTTSPGAVYAMDLDILHAVDTFSPATTSLTVYAPRVKHRTTVFNTLTGRAEYRWSFSEATRQLQGRLQNLANS